MTKYKFNKIIKAMMKESKGYFGTFIDNEENIIFWNAYGTIKMDRFTYKSYFEGTQPIFVPLEMLNTAAEKNEGVVSNYGKISYNHDVSHLKENIVKMYNQACMPAIDTFIIERKPNALPTRYIATESIAVGIDADIFDAIAYINGSYTIKASEQPYKPVVFTTANCDILRLPIRTGDTALTNFIVNQFGITVSVAA